MKRSQSRKLSRDPFGTLLELQNLKVEVENFTASNSTLTVSRFQCILVF